MILIKRQCGIYHIVSFLMLYNIIVVFAQPECETIGERVYARVKKGAWGGGSAAYGFELI